VIAIPLAACGSKGPASVEQGGCQIFKAEIAKACGLTREDQQIIDENAEAGFGACPSWDRPAARKPTCEELRASLTPKPKSVVVPPKKRTIWDRLKTRL
jgi:hypothetical protein